MPLLSFFKLLPLCSLLGFRNSIIIMFWQLTTHFTIHFQSLLGCTELPCYPTCCHYQSLVPHSAQFIWASRFSMAVHNIYSAWLLSSHWMRMVDVVLLLCYRGKYHPCFAQHKKWHAKLAFKVRAWCHRELLPHLEGGTCSELHTEVTGFSTLQLGSVWGTSGKWKHLINRPEATNYISSSNESNFYCYYFIYGRSGSRAFPSSHRVWFPTLNPKLFVAFEKILC